MSLPLPASIFIAIRRRGAAARTTSPGWANTVAARDEDDRLLIQPGIVPASFPADLDGGGYHFAMTLVDPGVHILCEPRVVVGQRNGGAADNVNNSALPAQLKFQRERLKGGQHFVFRQPLHDGSFQDMTEPFPSISCCADTSS